MKAQLNNIYLALATLVWGSVPVWFYATGRINSYLQRDLPQIALFGGLGMLVLSLYILLTLRENTSEAHTCSCDHNHDHGEHEHHHHNETEQHDHNLTQGPWTILLFMLLPLGIALATTTDEYSQKALMEKGLYDNSQMNSSFLANIPTYTKEQLDKNTSKTEDGYYQLDLSELYFAAGVQDAREVFQNLPIETQGQITLEQNSEGTSTRRRLYRVLMTCCAADAMAIGISLEFNDLPLPESTTSSWFKIAGKINYENTEGTNLPILNVEKITPSDKPYSSIMERGF